MSETSSTERLTDSEEDKMVQEAIRSGASRGVAIIEKVMMKASGRYVVLHPGRS